MSDINEKTRIPLVWVVGAMSAVAAAVWFVAALSATANGAASGVIELRSVVLEMHQTMLIMCLHDKSCSEQFNKQRTRGN